MAWRSCLALALLASVGCGGAPAFERDEVRAEMVFDWGPQRARDGVEELIASCEEALGFGYAPGAWIKFVRDANRECELPAPPKVAGCWLMHFDVILVEPAESLASTALCHELLHRELYRREGDPDASHTGEAWARLSTGLSSIRAALPDDRSDQLVHELADLLDPVGLGDVAVRAGLGGDAGQLVCGLRGEEHHR